MQEERSVANGTPKRESSGPVAGGENEDSRGLVENYGVGVAEVARQVGISTSAVFEDPDENFVQLVNSVPLVPVATPDQRLNSPTIRWRKRARLSETDLPRPDSGWPGC